VGSEKWISFYPGIQSLLLQWLLCFKPLNVSARIPVADHVHALFFMQSVGLLTPALENCITFIKMQTVYDSTFWDLNLYTFLILTLVNNFNFLFHLFIIYLLLLPEWYLVPFTDFHPLFPNQAKRNLSQFSRNMRRIFLTFGNSVALFIITL
jgi:hypothetical protein